MQNLKKRQNRMIAPFPSSPLLWRILDPPLSVFDYSIILKTVERKNQAMSYLEKFSTVFLQPLFYPKNENSLLYWVRPM